MMNKYKLTHITVLLLMAVLGMGCTDEVLPIYENSTVAEVNDAVTFTTYMLAAPSTRATDQASLTEELRVYKKDSADYELKVEMYEEPATSGANPTLLGSAVYVPTKSYTYDANQVKTDSTYAADGTLQVKTGSTPLYWPGNAKKYGFKAMAGPNNKVITDQSSAALLLAQDSLVGYGFEPVWDTTNNQQLDDENALNYHTSKEWYDYNKTTYGMVPGGVNETAFFKKIPLYLQHQRSLITIILKAGEGVDRSVLAYEKALTNISTKICSYASGDATPDSITPFAQQTTVDYGEGDYGTAATGVATTKYTAVVVPHDYQTKATEHAIAEIKLSGQRFTFYASNDSKYETDATHMAGYNLTAGKHLVITATLGRASRKILITAYVEDWTEAFTTSVVDDYGQAGDPIQINNRDELLAFLNDNTKNKPGNVAIIVPGKLNLEKLGDEAKAWDTPKPLNCTLNLAGATIYTDHQIFSNIGSSGTLVNGTIAVGNGTITTAVADSLMGTIERVNIVTKDENNNNSTALATRAGVVVTNCGTISSCTSVLPVKAISNFDGFIGGIAAKSVYASAAGSAMPVIDGCTVNAMVAEADNESEQDGKTYGGGIVGQAEGRVTNNTYEYGITIRQNASRLKNILQSKAGTDHELRAYGNAWPTTATNAIEGTQHAANPNETPVADRFTAVIDTQSDLDFLMGSAQYNTTDSRIRLSNDFALSSWTRGKKEDLLSGSQGGNVFFELDGNDKTITTDGMLFSNIQSHVYDLTVKLSNDLVADTLADGTEAIAALAYAVVGGGENGKGKISNIKVKGGSHRIQAATVGGIVVWAYDKAVIEDCECSANIQVWTKGLSEESKTYAGGIAACAAEATFTRCTFHKTDNTLFRNTASKEKYKTESVNGETTLHAGIFYGGILGGTVPKGDTNQETPSVLITDCTSWFGTSNTVQKGAIVGYALYPVGTAKANGIADGCQGNWWNTTSVGIGTYLSGKTIEQLIGKRNAVKPTQNTTFDN